MIFDIILLVCICINSFLIILFNRKKDAPIISTQEDNISMGQEPYVGKLTKDIEEIFDDDFKPVKKYLKANTYYTIIEEKDGKGKLFSGEGWINLSDLEKENAEFIPFSCVINYATPVFSGPSAGFVELGTLNRGQKVEVCNKYGVWSKIVVDGRIGYARI